MICKYTGCSLNSSHQTCRGNTTPDKCAFGKQEKRVEVAYEKGIEYGQRMVIRKVLQLVFPGFEECRVDEIFDKILAEKKKSPA